MAKKPTGRDVLAHGLSIIYWGNFTLQEDYWQKNTTRFGQFLLVFDEWMTIKFKHCSNLKIISITVHNGHVILNDL